MENENINEIKTPEHLEVKKTVEEKVEKSTSLNSFLKPKKELLPYEKENYSTIEKAIIELSEELTNLSELKDAIEHSFRNKNIMEDKFQENITTTFNSLCEKIDEFNEKFKTEIDYRAILEEKIKNNELDGRNLLLQRELEKERATITKNLDEINNLVKTTLQSVNDKCKELKTANNIIEEQILKFRADSQETEKQEIKTLTLDVTKILTDFTKTSKETLEVIKKHSIDFIKQCDIKNEGIIKKIPGVKEKLTYESWLVIILGCLGIAGFLLNLLK